MKVHRLAYELCIGEIPKGMVIKHKCDNKLCVNPHHLELGTYSENLREAYARGLRKPKQSQRGPVRLSESQVDHIQKSDRSIGALSKEYGISPRRVKSIKSGVVILRELDIAAIRSDSGTIKELALKYGISKARLAKVRDGCYEKCPPISPEIKNQVIKLSQTMRFDQHPNYSGIGKVLGISRQTVKKILTRSGIISPSQA